MYVVLIETSGNQNYIFATNKLRENVGASELTYQVGTRLVLEEVGGERNYDWENDRNGNELRELLLAEAPIEDTNNKRTEEIIVATSGKALLVTRTKERAEEIVRAVTTRALKGMPGLNVHGAIEKIEGDLSDIHEATGRVHRRLETLRYRIPSNQQRFLRLPYVEPCATSGLPASEIYRHDSLEQRPGEWKPHSSLSIAKQENAETGRKRLKATIDFLNKNVHLATSIYGLEKKFEDTKWIAIIHADGNGVGEIFLNFEENSNAQSGREYINQYRAFSIALDISTLNAASVAIGNFQASFQDELKKKGKGLETIEIPFVPLILGGDDLTIICDGQFALKLTKDFLEEFENETEQLDRNGRFKDITSKLPDGLIGRIANNAFGNKDPQNPSVKRLGICAGVVIVKPHYPFHQAYDLAEKLLKSAKDVKTRVKHKPKDKEVQLPCSAMDFHILYDSSGVALKDIREKLVIDEEHQDRVSQTYLYAKPYIVTPGTRLENAINQDWLTPRTWDQLATRVCAMAKTEDGKRELPNSQMHHIRESLYRGQRQTDSEVDLFRHRYEHKGFRELLADKDSLFFAEPHNKNGVDVPGHTTHFLDALDAVEFWKGFDCNKTNPTNETGEAS